MQLSSLVLSATALLAQSASGFLIHCPALDNRGYENAQVYYDEDNSRNLVGFLHSSGEPWAEISLNSDGILDNGYVLREVGTGEWLFTKAVSSEVRFINTLAVSHGTLLTGCCPLAYRHNQPIQDQLRARVPIRHRRWCVERLCGARARRV